MVLTALGQVSVRFCPRRREVSCTTCEKLSLHGELMSLIYEVHTNTTPLWPACFSEPNFPGISFSSADRTLASQRTFCYHRDTAMQIETSCSHSELKLCLSGYGKEESRDTNAVNTHQKWCKGFVSRESLMSHYVTWNMFIVGAVWGTTVKKKKKRSVRVILLWGPPLYRDWCPLKFGAFKPAANLQRTRTNKESEKGHLWLFACEELLGMKNGFGVIWIL